MIADVQSAPEIEAVLDEFAALPGPPDAATLREWTLKYPQFAREIVAMATDWVAMDAMQAERAPSAEDVDLVVNRTMSRVQTLLDAADRAAPLTDLTSAIEAAGYDFSAFESRIGIDRSILDSLIARLAKPKTLPSLLIRSIADVLHRTLAEVRDYFRLPAQLAGAHKSRKRPTAAQVDFKMLVGSSSLPLSEKDRWMNEPPDPELQD